MTKKPDPENVRVLQKLRSGKNGESYTYKLGVPAWVRKMLGIEGGDDVEYMQDGDRVYIQRAGGNDEEE